MTGGAQAVPVFAAHVDVGEIVGIAPVDVGHLQLHVVLLVVAPVPPRVKDGRMMAG